MGIVDAATKGVMGIDAAGPQNGQRT